MSLKGREMFGRKVLEERKYMRMHKIASLSFRFQGKLINPNTVIILAVTLDRSSNNTN